MSGHQDGADGWDELFAKASGSTETTNMITSSTTTAPHQSGDHDDGEKETSATNKHRATKKRRKRGGKKQPSLAAAAAAAPVSDDTPMAQARIHNLIEFRCPSWCCLVCLNKEQQGDSNPQLFSTNSQQEKRRCCHCQLSQLEHKLAIHDVDNPRHPSNLGAAMFWYLQLFCNVRNIRCFASSAQQQHQLMRQGGNKKMNKMWTSRPESDDHNTKKEEEEEEHPSPSSSLWRLLPTHQQLAKTRIALNDTTLQSDWDTLRRQVAQIIQTGAAPTKLTPETDGSNSRTDGWVRLIIACDALYYRLYYLQLTNAIPNHGRNLPLLPPPLQYFGFFVYQSDRDGAKKDQSPATSADTTTILQHYFGSLEQADHPLAQIHQLRLEETQKLFQHMDYTPHDFLRALEDFTPPPEPAKNRYDDDTLQLEQQHETPAPPLLMEWRDSCRDYLCHLYAYATLPGAAVSSFVDKVRSIVEIGAGTGYVANWLQNRFSSVRIRAYDLVVPSSAGNGGEAINEYHGQTPTFFPVQTLSRGGGAADDANRRFRLLQSVFNTDTEDTSSSSLSLLLCYPPPQSDMAYDTLKAFGGARVVHVGEFRGLTGNAKFESLLRSEFLCTHRVPCWTWGTDAAHVTVWERREGDEHAGAASTLSSSSSPSSRNPSWGLLLPCIRCERREARKRCRLVRHAVFCGVECWREQCDGEVLKQMCRKAMIPVGVLELLEFDNEQHFLTLPKTTIVRKKTTGPEAGWKKEQVAADRGGQPEHARWEHKAQQQSNRRKRRRRK